MPSPRADTVRYLITIATMLTMHDTVAVKVSRHHHMQIQRVTSLLQGIASARGWLIQHIPMTGSMAGYDLFLQVANDCMSNRPIVARTLLAEMNHPEESVLQQLEKMEEAGLLGEQPPAIDPHQRTYRPTEKFVALLASFSKQFESIFILRKNLRDQQLVVMTPDAAMRELVESLYDHFYDLGWLYLYNFGSVCFLMASVVARVATGYGYRARVASCHVEILRPEGGGFRLGAQGSAGPGQVDGHAVCILEESVLVDFGLGNVRRAYRRDFPWAIACDYRRDDTTMAAIAMAGGETVSWKDDWQSPATATELARYAPHLDELYKRYQSYFG
ncbi:MAG: hypothetical protein JWQ01_1483 [Massilia sp.]|nr:hypothetical protein [Massilia sp.]